MIGENRRPLALIASAFRWASAVRIAKSLSAVGFDVGFLGPVGHPIDTASFAGRRIVLNPFRPTRSLADAIARLKPDIVIPGDEIIVVLLHELYRDKPDLRDLIERSLGAPENYGKTVSRVALAEIARQEGIAVPRTINLAAKGDLAAPLALPAYVKLDGFCGGAAVVRVETTADAVRAYRRLHGFLGIPRTAWRIAVHGDTTRLPLRRARMKVSIQEEVVGKSANCAVAAWRGEMLACVEVMALQTHGPTGSSSVVQVLRDQPMREACRRLVKRLGLSGLVGFDFIIEAATGRAVLIELNPRATQTCHLRLGVGADPPEALRAAVTQEAVRETPPIFETDIIELFPRAAFAR
jgi:predicted ATP-grasp superfamily ATP-dependent carboligase